MNHPHSVSRRVWLVFVGSVLLFGGAWWLTRYAPHAPDPAAAEIAALTAERERLRNNSDAQRERLQEQQRGLTRLAWTPAMMTALQDRLGTSWRWTWEPGDPPVRAVLLRTAPRIEDWPAYSALVTELAGRPGVIVESLEVLADGTARDRRITRVAIRLRFIVAVAPSRDGQRAAPSRSPPTVAPAQGPATPRTVGASAPRRRPSASAEPAATGTAVTSLRPRPSGS